jgi:hypothetical protein
MAEGKRQYYDRETMAMARYISRSAVKDEIMRKGLKLREFSAKQITELGDEYLRSHAEKVMQEVRTWQFEREVVQILKLVHRKRKTEIKGKSLCTSHAQNGARR